MSADAPEPIAFVARPALEQQPAILDTTAPTHPTRAATPEERRAIAAVFSEQKRESAQVAALLGAWSAGMLIHDLIQDTFGEQGGEVEPEVKKKEKTEPK
ncbi:MAG TPA: hypothetical protein VEL76_07075 [Gemmataceae bacterium]|nr:hypothetical protein [Gemmataceae bacterium]